jgi:hypothetical protein
MTASLTSPRPARMATTATAITTARRVLVNRRRMRARTSYGPADGACAARIVFHVLIVVAVLVTVCVCIRRCRRRRLAREYLAQQQQQMQQMQAPGSPVPGAPEGIPMHSGRPVMFAGAGYERLNERV